MTTEPIPKSTTRETCEVFDISRSALQKWIRKGCPHTKTPEGNRFDLRAVRDWKQARTPATVEIRGEQPATPGSLRERTDEAKLEEILARTRKVNLAIARQEGELVDREEADARVTRVAGAFVDLLDGLVARLAPVLAGLDDEQAVELELRSAFDGLRRMIADGKSG